MNSDPIQAILQKYDTSGYNFCVIRKCKPYFTKSSQNIPENYIYVVCGKHHGLYGRHHIIRFCEKCGKACKKKCTCYSYFCNNFCKDKLNFHDCVDENVFAIVLKHGITRFAQTAVIHAITHEILEFPEAAVIFPQHSRRTHLFVVCDHYYQIINIKTLQHEYYCVICYRCTHMRCTACDTYFCTNKCQRGHICLQI